jgi:GT2 family glycosyltransferase
MGEHLPPVSVVTVNYNHSAYLDAYLKSVLASTYPIAEIIIVDNASADNSLQILNRFDQVKVIQNERNLGYSLALNQAFEFASSPLVCATGPDVEVEPDWLEPLVERYLQDPDTTFAVVSQVITMDRSEIQSAGSSLHFTGHLNVHEMWKRVESLDHSGNESMEVGAVDSTSVLFDREKFIAIGGCDPDFFVYHEEFDYCYRARMRGWRCWYRPQSMVYHGSGTQSFSVRDHGQYPVQRPFVHNRNRLMSILKNYQLRTILGVLPALMIVEFLNVLMLLRLGMLGEYFSALGWLWRNRQKVTEKRKRVQPMRCLNDDVILGAEPLTFSPLLFRNPAMKFAKLILDRCLWLYWQILRKLVYGAVSKISQQSNWLQVRGT